MAPCCQHRAVPHGCYRGAMASEESELLRLLHHPATVVAPQLLGAVVRHSTPDGTVAVRLTEVEAYQGPADSHTPDPGSHSFRGQTARNSVMFGPPGHFYVYFTYGMHYCANIVCAPAGTSSGVLLRAGKVIDGLELARHRRQASRNDNDLAQGPARLASALGMGREHNGAVLHGGDFEVTLGSPLPAAAYPWRFWIAGDPTVSRYKAAAARRPAQEPVRRRSSPA
jgi:DNA-3-methyladenine glycosylase